MSTYYIYNIVKENNSELFAFTGNKKYAKKFENQRDMSLFKKRTVDLSSAQIERLLEDYPEYDLVSLKITIDDLDNNISFKEKFIVTKNENMNFKSVTTMTGIKIFTHCWLSPNIFNKEIREALEVLGYYKLHYQSIGHPGNLICKDYEEDNSIFKVNEYNILFSIIGDTLK